MREVSSRARHERSLSPRTGSVRWHIAEPNLHALASQEHLLIQDFDGNFKSVSLDDGRAIAVSADSPPSVTEELFSPRRPNLARRLQCRISRYLVKSRALLRSKPLTAFTGTATTLEHPLVPVERKTAVVDTRCSSLRVSTEASCSARAPRDGHHAVAHRRRRLMQAASR